MISEKFVLFYNTPNDPKPSEPYEHGADSLIDCVTEACRVNYYSDDGARALRVESGGRAILGEAALLEIAHDVRARERLMLAESPGIDQINLRVVVHMALLSRGLIDEQGDFVRPSGGPPTGPLAA